MDDPLNPTPTDTLNGKFFLDLSGNDTEVHAFAQLIEPITLSGDYYATLLDETSPDGREIGRGLVNLSEAMFRRGQRRLLFDTKAELLDALRTLKKPARKSNKPK